MKRKLVLFLMMGTLTFSLMGCGGSEDSLNEESRVSDTVSEQEESQALEGTEILEESVETEVMTAQKLVAEMAAATEGKQMLQASVDTELEMSLVIGEEVAMEMGMHTVTDSKMSMEPYAYYAKSVLTMDMGEQQTTTESEVYMVQENGTIVCYMYDPGTDTWQKMDSGVRLEEAMKVYTGYDWMKEKTAEELFLEEATQTVEGREVYVLKCTLNGQEMQQALGGMSDMEDLLSTGGMSVWDYTMLTVPTIFYIDVETCLPVQIDMNIEGMSEMMNSLMAEAGTEDGENVDTGMNISKVHAFYSNISYEPVEMPALPEEALVMTAPSDLD